MDLFYLLTSHPPIISTSISDIKSTISLLHSVCLTSPDLRCALGMCPELLTTQLSDVVLIFTFILWDIHMSLLFEACGRTVNPVNGAVGLLWMGKWHVCQLAVETVLHGGVMREMPEMISEFLASETNDVDIFRLLDPSLPRSKARKRKDLEGVTRLIREAFLRQQLS